MIETNKSGSRGNLANTYFGHFVCNFSSLVGFLIIETSKRCLREESLLLLNLLLLLQPLSSSGDNRRETVQQLSIVRSKIQWHAYVRNVASDVIISRRVFRANYGFHPTR